MALTPGSVETPGLSGLERRCRAAFEAGLPGLLVREPSLLDRDVVALCRSLRAAAPGLWLCLHDRPHLASALGVNAVHLGFRSLPPCRVRDLLPPGIALGLSTHGSDDPKSTRDLDYVTHGPVHDTPSKRGLLQPIGEAGLARFVEARGGHVAALGGLTPEVVSGARRAGASSIFALGGILQSSDVSASVRRYLDAWETAA